MEHNKEMQLFENRAIRTAWDENQEEWYFSIVDVVAVLTGSSDPSAYWRKLKQHLKEEGNETVTNCHGLKMKAADGKKRLTDVATTEQLLRIIQSIPSPNARKELEQETGQPVITAQTAAQLNSLVTDVIAGVSDNSKDNP